MKKIDQSMKPIDVYTSDQVLWSFQATHHTMAWKVGILGGGGLAGCLIDRPKFPGGKNQGGLFVVWPKLLTRHMK